MILVCVQAQKWPAYPCNVLMFFKAKSDEILNRCQLPLSMRWRLLELVDFRVIHFRFKITQASCIFDKVLIRFGYILFDKCIQLYETLAFVFVRKRMVVCERYNLYPVCFSSKLDNKAFDCAFEKSMKKWFSFRNERDKVVSYEGSTHLRLLQTNGFVWWVRLLQKPHSQFSHLSVWFVFYTLYWIVLPCKIRIGQYGKVLWKVICDKISLKQPLKIRSNF